MAQVYTMLRRRVSDAVEDAFRRACVAGDVVTARELLAVLEGMSRRGAGLPTGDRRLSGHLHRLRRELERCEVLQPQGKGDAGQGDGGQSDGG